MVERFDFELMNLFQEYVDQYTDGNGDIKSLEISSIYLGGVPEELEIAVLPDLGVEKSFTGCLQLVSASASEYSPYSNKAKKNISGPLKSKNVKFCDGESACQGTRDCQSGQTCQEMENQAFCNDRDSTDLEYTASPKFNGQRFDIYSKLFSDNFSPKIILKL